MITRNKIFKKMMILVWITKKRQVMNIVNKKIKVMMTWRRKKLMNMKTKIKMKTMRKV